MVAKRFSTIRCLLVAIGLCAAGVLFAVEMQDVLITFTAGSIPGGSQPLTYDERAQPPAPRNFNEFIVDADGSVVGFAKDASNSSAAYRWRAGKWSRVDNLNPEGQVLDAIQAPDGNWFVLSSRMYNEVFLYRYNGSSLSRVATVAISPPSPRGMSLHLAPDGAVLLASRGPIIYAVKDGKIATHSLWSESSFSIFSNSPYPPTSLTVPGRGLWFWSSADYGSRGAYEYRSSNGFHVYEDGQWRTVSPSGGQLGGAVPIDSNTILCATRNKGLYSLSLADGSIKTVDWALPDKEGCVFLHHTPSRNVLAITAAPAGQPNAAAPVAPPAPKRGSDAAIGKLVVFKDGRSNVLLDGIDSAERMGTLPGPLETKRPVVDTPQGTFISAVGRGIVFVSSDGSKAKLFDWRFNIPTLNAARMRVRDNLLYLLDPDTGLAVVDWTKLIRMPEPSPGADRWDTYTAAAEPTGTPDGAIWWLDRGKTPGLLNCWRDGKLTSVALENIRFNGTVQTVADTQGGIWLIPQSTDAPIACFKYEKWRRFENADAAWSGLAIEEKGNPSFDFVKNCSDCPAFSRKGRMAYRDKNRTDLHYFDGAAWQTIRTPMTPFYGSLYFENGILTIYYSNEYFQYVDGQWQFRGKQNPRNSGGQTPSAGAASVPPESFPGERSRCRIFFNDAAKTMWAGNPEELYRGLEDVWVRFPTFGTPLIAASYLTQVLIDASGDLWFVMNQGASHQLIHYRDSGKASTIEWATPPPAITKDGRIVFTCRTPQINEGRIALRYRVDEGPWRSLPSTARQPEIVVENLLNGMHKIEVRAYDHLLRSSPLLTSTFEVRRDYAAEVRDIISQLSDPNKREAAARALVLIGRPAVPALTAQIEKANSQLRWWIQAILDEIDRKEKERQ
jgi:hypothetical protein